MVLYLQSALCIHSTILFRFSFALFLCVQSVIRRYKISLFASFYSCTIKIVNIIPVVAGFFSCNAVWTFRYERFGETYCLNLQGG
jgi:hypothetical protein